MTPEAKKRRQFFEGFLRTKLPADSSVTKYSRSLDNKIRRFYHNKLGAEFSSIYEFSNDDAIYQIKNDVSANPTMVYSPGRRKNSIMEGIDYYLAYLNEPIPSYFVTASKHKRRVRLATAEMEGKHISREYTVIQRNPDARRRCIDFYGCKCATCGLVMSDKYGMVGDGFIEVHHLNPIHLFDDSHPVDYRTDLIPLCPNCHAMIHRLEDPGDIEGLKQLIEENMELPKDNLEKRASSHIERAE